MAPRSKKSTDTNELSVQHISRSQALDDLNLSFFHTKEQRKTAVRTSYRLGMQGDPLLGLVKPINKPEIMAHYQVLTINPILYWAMRHPWLSAGLLGLAIAGLVVASAFTFGLAGVFAGVGAAVMYGSVAGTALIAGGASALAAGYFAGKAAAKFNKSFNNEIVDSVESGIDLTKGQTNRQVTVAQLETEIGGLNNTTRF